MASPTRRPSQNRLISLAMATAITFLLAPAAQADPLDDAKSAGTIGEQLNGFLGLVRDDAPADVVALVKSVNGKRKDAYAEIAAKNGTSISAVAMLAGEKAIAKTRPGNYIQNASGGWEKK
jgi:uncharacterized protein YdbL (DUF1318 family)